VKESTLTDIVCPAEKGETHCHGHLSLAEDFPTLRAIDDESEIVEGLLRCTRCRAEYPILCSLAVLLPETLTWLRSNYSTILNVAVEQGITISRSMLDYLHFNGAHIPPRETSDGWNYSAFNRISLYLCAHYDNVLDTLSAAHPLTELLHQYYGRDLYSVLIQMLAPHLYPAQHALDIGCNVGRMSRELAAHCGVVYGVDMAFGAAFTARRALLGKPSQLTNYDLFRDGHIRESRLLDLPPLQNAEVLIASGTNLPFPDSAFDVVNSSNIIDVVSDPAKLVQEKRRALKDGGIFAMTDPYCWEISASIEKWPGGRNGITSIEGVHQLLESEFDVIAEKDNVPWVLREHDRKFSIYINHCVVGRKRIAARGGQDGS